MSKCNVKYTQGKTDSNWFKSVKYNFKAPFNTNDLASGVKNAVTNDVSGTSTSKNEICGKATKEFTKKANKWLKGSYEDADGTLQRTITNIKPIECKYQHKKGFLWLGKRYGGYQECGNKYDNKFENGLIKKL
jgi:hypothetical protein